MCFLAYKRMFLQHWAWFGVVLAQHLWLQRGLVWPATVHRVKPQRDTLGGVPFLFFLHLQGYRQSFKYATAHLFALFMTGFSLAWRPGGFTSCHCSLLLKSVLCLIKWFAVGYTAVLDRVFSYVLYLCDLMEFFFISDLASLCMAVGYRPGTVLGSGRGNWGALWD